MHEALCNFCQKEIIEYKKQGPDQLLLNVTKQISINKFPEILILNLKPYIFSSFSSKISHKQKISIICDDTINVKSFSYKLCSVVYHLGTDNSGHYVTKAYSDVAKSWLLFNDTEITRTYNPSKLSNEKDSTPYILFYKKM